MLYKEQVQLLDCGVCVVQILHNHYYDEWISISRLKSNVKYDLNGINTLELSKLASEFGINFEVYKGEAENLKELSWDEPFVVVIKSGTFLHYVVLEKIKNNYVYYCDPVEGNRKIPFEDFKEIYSGIIISCNKTSFKKINDNDEIKLFKFSFIKEMIWMSIISIIVVASTFVSSWYLKIVIDQIIPTSSKNTLFFVTIMFILLVILKLIITSIKSWMTHKIEIKYTYLLFDLYINKLSIVKWTKINYMNEGVHLKNLEMITSIAIFKSNYLTTFISQIFCLIFSTFILIWLDFNIFLITLFATCLIILMTILFRKKFNKIEKKNIKNAIELNKNFLEIISCIDQFKISDIRNNLLININKSVSQIIKNQNENKFISSMFDLLNSTIKNSVPFLIVILATLKIWNNDLSLGQMLLFMSIFNFFVDPLVSFTSMIIDIPITQQYIDNLNSFFLLENEDKNFSGNDCNKIESIKVSNLSFSFIEGKRVLKIPELYIDKNIHLTGKNSCGKTTLLRIFSTLINTKNISYNNKLIDYYNLENLRKQICLISQNELLPSGTIYSYLTNNQNEKINELLTSIDEYKLLDYFDKLNLNLHDKIEEFGKNLSSGQKQFVSILKLFSSNYSLVLLDEAFENLDNEIVDKLKEMLTKRLENKIVIEVSHRGNYVFNSEEINCEIFR